MRKNSQKLTTSQFAKLHEVNKRTLHYYDEIDLFSPSTKGENNYRYYDTTQSIDFEYIRMLKELHMSMDEIKQYRRNPNPHDFLNITDTKLHEIEVELQHLQKTQAILRAKKAQIEFCNTMKTERIEIRNMDEEYLLTAPIHFMDDDVSAMFSYAKDVWGIEQLRMGIGSYISMESIYKKEFDAYDGLFSPTFSTQHENTVIMKPKGKYLCGYIRGTWDRLPSFYENIMAFAKKEKIELIGNAYEIGLNDFVIAKEEDYVTQIMIQIKEGECKNL